MGNSTSTPNLTEELLEEYFQLTYLNKAEILRIYKRLSTINSDITTNLAYRYPWNDVMSVFPELKVNPFKKRLATVFSSECDMRLSFEDMLDMCSALSAECPAECKAKWALKLFDFSASNSLEPSDISDIIDHLTSGEVGGEDDSKYLNKEEKEAIANIILSEIDLDHTGSIVTMEFVHAVSKMPDFYTSFTMKV